MMNTNRLNLRNMIAIAICLVLTVFASCEKNENETENSLIGKWGVTPSYNANVEITKDKFNFTMGGPGTWSYRWVSDNSIEIIRPEYTTINEVIFHTLDRVTIKGFWLSSTEDNPSEDYDAILTRIKL
jgi:hypothetical protein